MSHGAELIFIALLAAFCGGFVAGVKATDAGYAGRAATEAAR